MEQHLFNDKFYWIRGWYIIKKAILNLYKAPSKYLGYTTKIGTRKKRKYIEVPITIKEEEIQRYLYDNYKILRRYDVKVIINTDND